MTTVAELQAMLAELDPDLPIGTLLADAGAEIGQNHSISFELFGFAHTTVTRDAKGKQQAAWLIANNLLAPGNNQQELAKFRPSVYPVRRPGCGCVLDMPVGFRSTVSVWSQPCPHVETSLQNEAIHDNA